MADPSVRRNFGSLILASVVFGLAVGIYDFLFPFYLDDLGLSFESMGVVFSLSAVVIAFASVYMASLSDMRGRKSLYALGIALGSISAATVPLFTRLATLTVTKTLRDAASRIRLSIHGVLIFELAKGRFADFWAKSRGMEFLSEGSGHLLAGSALLLLGFTGSFYLAAVLLAVALVAFQLGFQEKIQKTDSSSERPGLRETFSLDLPKPLALLAASAFIFAVGLSTSHNFVMPLFFDKKFGATLFQISLILGFHRLSLALPLLFSSRMVKYSLKKVYVTTLILEGLALSGTGLAPGLMASTALWLSHDIVGASLWLPIQALLIQRFARDEFRGRDVSKVRALGALGWIFGPLIAGWTSPISINWPFILSGILVAMSAIPLLFIRMPPSHGRAKDTVSLAQ
jgi:MFS family permease